MHFVLLLHLTAIPLLYLLYYPQIIMPSFRMASSDTTCHYCYKSFCKGAYQISVSRSDLWHRGVYHMYHIKCYAEAEDVRRPQRLCQLISDKRLDELDDVTRQDVLNIYPNVVWPWERRAVLKLSKPIEKLTVKELKLELMKRDLARPSRRNKKKDLVDILSRFIEQCSVKEIRSRYSVLGYCRRMEGRKYKMNVPEYLKQIVVTYYAFG